jgi:hypothetical protein
MSKNEIIDDECNMKMYDLTDDLKVGIQVLNIENLGHGEFNYSGFEIFTYKEKADGSWCVWEIWGVCEPINGKPYNSKNDIELPEIARDEISRLVEDAEEDLFVFHQNNKNS